MARTALYTVSVRLSKETIRKLEKYQSEHHLKSRSECLQQAVDRLLNPENPDENPSKTAILKAINDPDVKKIIEEIASQTFENTPLTLTRTKK